MTRTRQDEQDEGNVFDQRQASLVELRRRRGEGWEWPKIQTEPCPQCGDQPGSLPPGSLGLLALQRAARWQRFLGGADETQVRTNPEPGVFSPMQYGAHVRDILRVYSERMELGLSEDDPSFPSFNPPDEVWESYNHLDRAELARDLETQAQRLADIVAGVEPSGWSRTVVSNRGADGVYTFTVAGLACCAVHEARHHLLDAEGQLAGSGQAARERQRPAPLRAEEWDDTVLGALRAGRASLVSDALQEALDEGDTSRLSAMLPGAVVTMLRHPELAGTFLAFNGTLLGDPALEPRQRELLVLRVASRTGSEEEWKQHARMASRYGVSDDEVSAIASDRASCWTPLEADLLRAADQFLEHYRVDDATWERLSAHLDDRQLVEVPFVVGTYACLAMVFNRFSAAS